MKTTTERPALHTSARGCIVLITTVVAGVDWASKLVASALLDGRVVELWVMDLRLAHNPGIAFGVAAGAPSWLVLTITTVGLCALAAAAWRGMLGSPLAAGLLLGGAIANVVDRTIDGTVVDVIDLGWWPTFNLADVAITSGAALLALHALRAQPSPA